MKFWSLILLVIITQNHNVNCYGFFDYVGNKLNEFSFNVHGTWNTMIKRMKNALGGNEHKIQRVNQVDNQQLVLEEKIKKAFHEFVDRTAAMTDVDGPEYINLRSEPTAMMSTPQLAILHGRRIETHVIKTSDGYILSLHRILNLADNITLFHEETVLLHHGLLGSSADWILLGPSNSLPYHLRNSGYDVWMTNARGNYYSRGHVTKKVNSSDYWNFSFQEMGVYDLPAAVDYIRKKKNSTKAINFVGHSMGASAFLVMLSTIPKYNDYFKVAVLVAPLAFMNNAEGPLRILTSMSTHPPDQLLKIIGDTEYLPSRKVPKIMSSKFCQGSKIYCSNPLLFLTNEVDDKFTQDPGFLARLLFHVPAGGSTNTIMHYGQIAHHGKFHQFNKPAHEFPLHLVTVPTVLISSSDDCLATVPDVLRLYFSLANPIDHYVIRGANITHTDFVWGSHAVDTVFIKVIEYLKNGAENNAVQKNEV